MAQVDRIWDFLRRLSPVTRSCLLTELERLEVGGVEMAGFAEIQARLRAEFRKDGSTQTRAQNPSRYFFAPVEPLLIDGAPEHANAGRIPRVSLTPIWEWICRDLLPTMARDFIAQMTGLIAADKQKEAQQVASAFQTKVVKYLESTLGSPDAADQTRARLATYTASRFVYEDLVKIMCAMRARDALAKFDTALPKKILKFDDATAHKITQRLDAFAKQHADAVPFAIALVAGRLKTPWQVMRLATKNARSKKAVDVAAVPYAVAVSMVLDRLEDHRAALRIALRHNRVLVAKDLLADIYDSEYALRVRIDRLDDVEWGVRLRSLMNSIAALVEAEINRFPDEVGHVLGSRRLRSYQSLSGRLTYLSWKARDAINDGAAFCKKLITAA
ncbi:hypothetical protein [Bradyrhizobium sp.]|uniref:hypothetical protein n=1 Tax=Bradyrhizobium sp. TaxID=376 RepID=UPI003C57E45C